MRLSDPAFLDQTEGALAPSELYGVVIWLTGLSSAGKTTIGGALFDRLRGMGYKTELLDGDVVRQHLSKDLGFSREDRDENIRRIVSLPNCSQEMAFS
jgi:adenylylsulfate kinase